MAEGIASKYLKEHLISSAGTLPEPVNPNAIKSMEEIGIDISNHTSDHIDDYLSKNINIAITVCDKANDTCPIFPGKVQRLHWRIADPLRSWNYDREDLDNFRVTRERIKGKIIDLLSLLNIDHKDYLT